MQGWLLRSWDIEFPKLSQSSGVIPVKWLAKEFGVEDFRFSRTLIYMYVMHILRP